MSILNKTIYYKNFINSFLFPKSFAVKTYKLFETPKYPQKIPDWEKEFEKKNKFNIIKIPFQEHIEIIKERINKNSISFKLTRIPKFPEKLIVLEYLPNSNILKRNETIVCVHGWDGRGFNFYKFIPKFLDKGFRVLVPDFPKHGKTEGIECGCHVFGHSINTLIHYINAPVYILAHSLGNAGVCVNYGISDEVEKKSIKRYAGLSFFNHSLDIVKFYENMIGLSNRCHPYFFNECSKNLGFDFNKIAFGKIIREYNIPTLLIHDKNDKELVIENARKSAELLKYKNYVVNDEIKPCFYESEGLGHRRILRDEKIVDRVVEFFSENIKLQN